MLDLDYLKNGITGEFKTSSCVRIAAALGITCEENTCDECMRKEAEAIEKLAKNACIMYDVNGEKIRIGDTVYFKQWEYTVLWYVTGGREVYAKREGSRERVVLDVLNLTHKKPETDTLDKIKADAIAFYTDYFGCSLPDRVMCHECPSLIEGKKPYEYYGAPSCIQAKDLDIIRRVQEVCSRV